MKNEFYDNLFDQKYKLLLKFNRKFGTTSIPSRPGKKWLSKLNEKQINQIKTVGRFVETLRRQYHKGELLEYKIDMLNLINFEWISKSKKENYLQWTKKMDRLEKFKKTYGHCNVPENWEKDTELASFVASSRVCYRKRKLRNFKIIALEDIGFDWSPGKETKKRNKNGRFIKALKSPVIDGV